MLNDVVTAHDSLIYQQLFRYAEDIQTLLDQNSRLELNNETLVENRIDSVTGLPTRDFLVEQAAGMLLERTESQKLLLVALNVSGLRKINNALGREAGDQMLRHVGDKLRRAILENDLLARVEGDEFVIVSRMPASYAEQSIAQELSPPFIIDGDEISIAVSMGGAYVTNEDSDLLSILRKASVALGIARSYRLHHICIYAQAMDSLCSRESMAIDTGIWHAAQRDELYLVYQPRVATQDGRTLEGVEALLRWSHPVLGNIPPSTFIPAAERNGAIVTIGAWVLRNSCQQLKAWKEAGIANMTMAVNVSPHQLRSDTFLDTLEKALEETAISPESLELEIIESEIMSSFDLVKDILTQIRDIGVRIAIDDFGTGHSNLSRLRDLPVNRLKIDRSLVCDIATDPRAQAVVSCIVGLASALDVDIIAEGVESGRQFEQLKTLGCHYVQGYLFGRPLRPDDLPSWISSN